MGGCLACCDGDGKQLCELTTYIARRCDVCRSVCTGTIFRASRTRYPKRMRIQVLGEASRVIRAQTDTVGHSRWASC